MGRGSSVTASLLLWWFLAPSAATAATIVVTLTGTSQTGATQTIGVREVVDVNKTVFATTPSPGADALAIRNALIGENGESSLGITFKRVTVNGAPGFKTVGDVDHQARVFDGVALTLLEPGTTLEYDGIVYSASDPDVSPPVGAGTVPTVTQWGLILLTLALMSAGLVVFRRRVGPAASF